MAILSTNQKLVRVGQEYSAGENIGIDNYTISSRNWSPDITYAAESAYQRAKDYTDTEFNTVSGYLSSTVPQLEGQIQFVSGGVDYISGVALTSHQSLEGYLTKASGDEYYQPIGSYATVSQLESTSGEIVNLIPTDFVTNEQLQTNSAAITAMIPSTAGLASEQWVEEQGYLTAHQSLENYYPKSATSGAEQLAEAFSQIGPGGDEEVNELVHSNSGEWNNVSSKLDESAFQETSGLFLTAIPQEYITESDIPNYISAKLDTTAFADVSGDFLTAHQDLSDYATTADLALKQDTLTFGYDEQNKISAINNSAIAGGGTDGVSGTNAVFVPYYEGANNGNFYSATISGDVVVTTGMYFDNGAYINPIINYSLSSIGSKIDNKLDKNKIEDSNTIAIINNHAEVTDKAYRTTGFDTTSATLLAVNSNYVLLDFHAYNVNPDSHLYSATVTVETTESGTYIPNGWSLVNYENNSAIFTRYYPLDETSDTFNLPNGGGWRGFTNAEGSATVYSALEVGHLAFKDEIPSTANFYPNTNPSSFVNEDWVTAQGYLTEHQDISNKLDTTAFSTVSGDFLTAVDLTPYQTTAGMTAYQPAGSYATTNELEQVSADITATIPSTAGLASESYVQTNSAVLTGMIDAKQDTLTFGYDEQDRINSINNSALAGGGDVPEGTMVESSLEYNSQGYINGYNGSAVATIDQERQWFTHDRNPLSFKQQ